MNSSVLLRSFSAVFAMGAFSSLAHSQVLTASTITGVENDAEYHASPALGNGTGLTQTFTGFDSIDTVTFRFLAHGGTFSATNLTVYFSEWLGNDAPIGSSALFTGSIAINASSSGWTVADSFTSYFDASIDLSSVSGLNSGTVYGLTVVGNSVSAGNFTISSDLTNSYTGGAGSSHAGVGSFSGLTNGGTAATYDFSFAAGVGGGASPVPEASTAAVLFAGVFVGGMMTRRRPRQSVALDAAQA